MSVRETRTLPDPAKPNGVKKPVKRKLTSFQIIILGFATVILLGALLLMLPVSSAAHRVTPFGDTLFTAVSATCVTGLVVKDTGTYWSYFGQAVILILIEIGGLGVVSIAAFIMMISGKRITLLQRQTLQNSISAPQVGGIVRMLRKVFKTAFIIEAVGVLILMPMFCKLYGVSGIWMAVFHSISAFCNAGFDIMGPRSGPFTSLTSFIGHPGITITIVALIVVGGIGFLTWDDVGVHKLKLHRYRMQSKVILVTTAVLIAVPTLIFFFQDFAALPLKERFCASLFQAVTPRTAGFNTADLTAMRGSSVAIIIMLMLIGGSPGSTAGGMKTTTIAVLFANVSSIFTKKEKITFFRRRVNDDAVKSAANLLVMYLSLALSSALIICSIESIDFGTCLFETASALGTAGLTLGITTSIGMVSKVILMILMFLGRVGSITMILAAVSSRYAKPTTYPEEKIAVG